MKAMILKKQNNPLVLSEIPEPEPNNYQIKIKIKACGICRTDLHIVEGDLNEPKLPLVPGHQIVGIIEKKGDSVSNFTIGDRVGVPWLGGSCGRCDFCNNQQENLCDSAVYTGYQINGGFAEKCVANKNFCFPIPDNYPDLLAAPLLCAGLIGYRAFRMVGKSKKIGLYGFGSAAHILIQVAKYLDRKIYVFTREGDIKSQKFAKELGADWVGSSTEPAPEKLEASIIFAPVGSLVVEALKSVSKGGIVVCAGIHMSDIPSFPYSYLWGERCIKSVANLTRFDGEEFLKLAPKIPIKTKINSYSLEKTNEALNDLRLGKFNGAGVIQI